MKRILTILLVVMLCFALMVPTFAQDKEVSIYRQTGVITEIGEEGYANVTDTNNENWSLEVEADAEVGDILVFWNSDNGTLTTEDDTTIFVLSKAYYEYLKSHIRW